MLQVFRGYIRIVRRKCGSFSKYSQPQMLLSRGDPYNLLIAPGTLIISKGRLGLSLMWLIQIIRRDCSTSLLKLFGVARRST